MPNAFIFDLFGTLARPMDRRDPYRRLIHALSAAGQGVAKRDALGLMREPLSLRQAWVKLAPELPINEALMLSLEADLQAELESVEPYPDALDALAWARERSIPFTVCSNLAAPYARALLSLPAPTAPPALSFENGLLKPEPAMFVDACARLGRAPTDCVMFGDRATDDYYGALEAGLGARLIDRSGGPARAQLARHSSLLEAVQQAVGRDPRPRGGA